jgi:hypothetical protein
MVPMGVRKPTEAGRARVDALELRLEASASPSRVALAAVFLDQTLRAANAHLPDDAVTLVVDNYALKATLRSRSDEGKRAIDLIEDVLRDPSASLVAREDLALTLLAQSRARDRNSRRSNQLFAETRVTRNHSAQWTRCSSHRSMLRYKHIGRVRPSAARPPSTVVSFALVVRARVRKCALA